MTALPIPYTSLASTGRRNLADLLPVPMPMSMHIEPTNICNFKCVSCPQTLPDYGARAGYHQHMDFALYEKILHDIRAMGRLKALKLFGYGEPMAHPELGRMIKLARELDVTDRIEMTSNISLLNEKNAQALIDGPLDYLRVSIYSLDQEAHRAFTGNKIDIERIFENLRRLRSMRDAQGKTRPYIYVKMFETVSPDEEAAFRARFADIGDELTLEVLHNMSGIDGIEQDLGIDIPDRPKRKVCPSPFYMSSVSAAGDVTICCIDWSWAAKIGNLRDQSLSEIWHGPELREVWRKHLEGRRHELRSCANCTWDWNHPDNIDDLSPAKIGEILRPPIAAE